MALNTIGAPRFNAAAVHMNMLGVCVINQFAAMLAFNGAILHTLLTPRFIVSAAVNGISVLIGPDISAAMLATLELIDAMDADGLIIASAMHLILIDERGRVRIPFAAMRALERERLYAIGAPRLDCIIVDTAVNRLKRFAVIDDAATMSTYPFRSFHLLPFLSMARALCAGLTRL